MKYTLNGIKWYDENGDVFRGVVPRDLQVGDEFVRGDDTELVTGREVSESGMVMITTQRVVG